MADVYRLPTTGGPNSERFKAYVALAGSGLPVALYNPMTSKPVLETIEALLAIDAEAIAERFCGDHDLSITVATPGLWTDRIATEIEYRLEKTVNTVFLWTGEEVSPDVVRRETIAQVVRIEHPARTARELAIREGLAYASGGEAGEPDEAVAQALEIVGDEASVPTAAALLYGDDAAKLLGFLPLGLADHAGYRHCIAVAAQQR